MTEIKNTSAKPQEYRQKMEDSLKQDRGHSLSQPTRESEGRQTTQGGQVESLLSESESETEQEYLYQLELARARQRMLQEEEAVRMEEEDKKPVPMSWLLFLPMLILAVVADIIDIFSGGTIGWAMGIFVDLLLLAVFGISKSGRKQFKRIIAGLLGDSVPIIAFLPIRTIFLIWAFISSRNEKLQTAGQITAKAALARVRVK